MMEKKLYYRRDHRGIALVFYTKSPYSLCEVQPMTVSHDGGIETVSFTAQLDDSIDVVEVGRWLIPAAFAWINTWALQRSPFGAEFGESHEHGDVEAAMMDLALSDIGRSEEGLIADILGRLDERAGVGFRSLFEKAMRRRDQLVAHHLGFPGREPVV